MAHKKSFFYYSLLVALTMMPSDSYSAIKISNKSRSYADAYNQVNEVRASVAAPAPVSAHTDDLGVVGKTEDSSLSVDLPIRVANKTLAAQVASGESTTLSVAQLEQCGAIYPNGEFAWDTPTAGTRSGATSQCVSVVEMRGYQMGPNGSDLVLARANIAAGDAVKCNISQWPEYSYLPAAGTITFPNDAEPTVEDVIAVMDQEQKQNAGLKIAAATLISAVAGNAMGANEPGSDAILGTNKEKLTSTAIAGLGGAAIMAGNVYGGKVAGDMILSAGVNAAAGGLIGNMVATGDSVLKVTQCQVGKQKNAQSGSNSQSATESTEEHWCLWGQLIKTAPKDPNTEYYYNTQDNRIYECDTNTDTCKPSNTRMEYIVLEGYCEVEDNWGCTPKTNDNTKRPYFLNEVKTVDNYNKVPKSYSLGTEDDNKNKMKGDTGAPNPSGNNIFAKIVSATIVDSTIPAAIVLNLNVKEPGTFIEKAKNFGVRQNDWDDIKKKYATKDIKGRNASGDLRDLSADEETNVNIDNFKPMEIDSEDGGLIDINNKARLKGTLVGAGAGGAMGAFTAYQGAQSEIQERWVSAVREYKDSLQKIYCATGNRYLTQYNDTVIIPNVTE